MKRYTLIFETGPNTSDYAYVTIDAENGAEADHIAMSQYNHHPDFHNGRAVYAGLLEIDDTEQAPKFDDWFNEIENYSSRSERFFAEIANNYMLPSKNLVEWLKAAYTAGFDAGSGSRSQ